MYEKVGEISEAERFRLLDGLPPLKTHGGGPKHTTHYQTTNNFPLEHLGELPIPRPWKFAFCVGIPPGGHLHPHTHRGVRYHIVLKTNDLCESWNGGERHHLEEMGIYWMQPELEHESFNRGNSDRLHIILETA